MPISVDAQGNAVKAKRNGLCRHLARQRMHALIGLALAVHGLEVCLCVHVCVEGGEEFMFIRLCRDMTRISSLKVSVLVVVFALYHLRRFQRC